MSVQTDFLAARLESTTSAIVAACRYRQFRRHRPDCTVGTWVESTRSPPACATLAELASSPLPPLRRLSRMQIRASGYGRVDPFALRDFSSPSSSPELAVDWQESRELTSCAMTVVNYEILLCLHSIYTSLARL